MPETCVNEKALESISWIAGLLKGKTGKDHDETLSFLKEKIAALEREDCSRCAGAGHCRALGHATEHLEEKPVIPDGPTTIGPLMHRRQARREWLNRGERWRKGKL